MNFIRQLATWLTKSSTLLRARYIHWQTVRAERAKVKSQKHVENIVRKWDHLPPWLQKRIWADIEKAEAEAKKREAHD